MSRLCSKKEDRSPRPAPKPRKVQKHVELYTYATNNKFLGSMNVIDEEGTAWLCGARIERDEFHKSGLTRKELVSRSYFVFLGEVK